VDTGFGNKETLKQRISAFHCIYLKEKCSNFKKARLKKDALKNLKRGQMLIKTRPFSIKTK